MNRYEVNLCRTVTILQRAAKIVSAEDGDEAIEIAWETLPEKEWEDCKVLDTFDHEAEVMDYDPGPGPWEDFDKAEHIMSRNAS